NTFYAPDLDMVYRMGDRTMVENPDFYNGEPVWVTAKKSGLVTASMFWVGSEAPVMGIQPDYWSKYDGSVPYTARIDSVINWLSLPAADRPRFITLYFDEPDGISHDFGPASHQTDSVVQYLDGIIGNLRDRIDELHVGRRVNLVVLSDHGMGEIDKGRVVNLWEIIPDRYLENYYGGNPVYQVDAVDLYIDSLMSIVDNTPGIKGWKKDDLPAHYHYGTNPRIPDIVVEADSSWSIVWAPRQGYIMRGKGAHGYDPANSDMHSIFYAVGPSFRKGYISPSFNNVDVYNIICAILRIDPAPNDGDAAIIGHLLK
ncbi:MAG: alkaline phosphatase family protein, partial [Bacteroidia bacterium]